ncbi:Rdx family-domain-containing protein [Bisporella sp. PMI_857]|nr:Rdx family-domain-containing protein [Bisporella sp. PMI_857]
MSGNASPPLLLPRVTIQFCTQCKWMLRAAYFAQELLSTFSTDLGEVALQPSTGGTFVVNLYTTSPSSADSPATIQEHLLWDRKAEGGFPETKELKRRVRDIIDPSRSLGHVDSHSSKPPSATPSSTPNSSSTEQQEKDYPPPLPRALNRLIPSAGSEVERKFTPMDIDPSSRPVSRQQGDGGKANEEKEVLNARGKVVITGDDLAGGDMGFCTIDGDCG